MTSTNVAPDSASAASAANIPPSNLYGKIPEILEVPNLIELQIKSFNWFGRKLFTHTLEEDKKTDLIIQVKPTIVKDNYSGIEKKYYHDQAERKLDVKDQ